MPVSQLSPTRDLEASLENKAKGMERFQFGCLGIQSVNIVMVATVDTVLH